LTTHGPDMTGNHKAQLLSDLIHATVVTIVVITASTLASLKVGLPQDVLGTVYGGAIGYAAGRAGNIARGRESDS
jgi:hypothetical protein